MRKTLLTLGSILSVTLPVATLIACGTKTKDRHVEKPDSSIGNGITDISTPASMDDKDKSPKATPKVQLIDPKVTKEKLKGEDIEQVRAGALDSIEGYLGLEEKMDDYKSKITLAKTKEEISSLMSQAWKESNPNGN